MKNDTEDFNDRGSATNGFLVVLVIILSVALVGSFFFRDEIMGFFDKNNSEEVSDNEDSNKSNKITAKDLVLKKSNIITNDNIDATRYEIMDASNIRGFMVSFSTKNPSNVVNFSINRNTLIKGMWQVKDGLDGIKDYVLDKKVLDVKIGLTGQDGLLSSVFFVLEDGTVSYVNIGDYLANPETKPKKLDKVNNVIKLFNARVSSKEGYVGGHVTVLAQQNDGKLYDLAAYKDGSNGISSSSKTPYYNILVDSKNHISKNDEKVKFDIYNNQGVAGFQFYYDLDNTKTINLEFNKDLLTERNYNKNLPSKKVLTFDKNISDIFVAGYGQTYGGETLYVLLEDGTVKYVNLAIAIRDNNFEVKTVKELTNIIKFYQASMSQDAEYSAVSSVTPIAQRSDGKFYNLFDYIEYINYY